MVLLKAFCGDQPRSPEVWLWGENWRFGPRRYRIFSSFDGSVESAGMAVGLLA